MTQFEFIAAAVSIVLALSLARLLGALPFVFLRDRRYWVHAVWVGILLPAHLTFWWAIWTYRDVDPWTLHGFAAVMLTPSCMFLLVTTLVTDDPGAIDSWREHFFARRRTFFALFLLSALSIAARQQVVLGDAAAPVLTDSPLPASIIAAPVAICCIGLIASAERVQASLALLMALLLVFSWARI